MTDVYHLELRQFPHVTRVFNLERAELETRFLRPWTQGAMIDHDERRWSPERTRLKVLEGPAVRPDELGLGRGWGAATKGSEDVTDAVLAQAERGARARPEVEALKEQLMQRAGEAVGMREVVVLAGIAQPGWRASEQLSVAEQAVWELLHQQRLTILAGGQAVDRERWQEVVLRFSTWAPGPGEPPVLLQVRHGEPADGDLQATSPATSVRRSASEANR
jgi:hypothetical protein